MGMILTEENGRDAIKAGDEAEEAEVSPRWLRQSTYIIVE